jgi:hypothetical protein
MSDFMLFASPWWVNLLIFVPIVLFVFFRKYKLSIPNRELYITGLFGIAFGYVEAAVVIHLRAASGLLPGYQGTLSDIIHAASGTSQQILLASQVPQSLLTVEFFREIATIVMLVCVGLLVGKKIKEQCAIFLWTFAFWDIFYYVWLWVLIRWPQSLMVHDVLFLIPVPWLSEVWFPCLVSILMILAIVLNTKKITEQN